MKKLLAITIALLALTSSAYAQRGLSPTTGITANGGSGAGSSSVSVTAGSSNIVISPSPGTGTFTVDTGASPTFGTSVTSPLHIGGTTASSTLTLESTSGVGTTDSIVFKTASQSTSATITSGGALNIASGAQGLQLNGQNAITYPSTDSTTFGSIAIGSQALKTQPSLASAAFHNTAIGYQALSSASMTTAALGNTAIGYQAGRTIALQPNNTIIGAGADVNGSNDSSETVIGAGATAQNDTGFDVVIGQGATAGANISNGGSVAIGAGSAATSFSVAIGRSANANTNQGSTCIGYTCSAQGQNSTTVGGQSTASGLGDVVVGNQSGGGNSSSSSNSVIGYISGTAITAGTNNVVIGAGVASTTLTTGTYNILIGTNSGVTTQAAGSTQTLNIGNTIYGTGIGTSGTSSTGVVGIGTATITNGAELTVNGLIGSQGGLPTCGAGCSSVTAGSTNTRGSMVSGSSVSAVTLNWSATLASTPICTISDSNTTATADISSISTSVLTVSLASALTSVTIYWICMQ